MNTASLCATFRRWLQLRISVRQESCTEK